MVEVKSYLTTWRIRWKSWVKFDLSNFCASFSRVRNQKFIPRVNFMKNYKDPSREKGKVLLKSTVTSFTYFIKGQGEGFTLNV